MGLQKYRGHGCMGHFFFMGRTCGQLAPAGADFGARGTIAGRHLLPRERTTIESIHSQSQPRARTPPVGAYRPPVFAQLLALFSPKN